MDPQKSSFVNELGPLRLFYEGLTRLDASLNTVPGAAESWLYNGDATQIEFTLRPGLQYSDGTVLNAKRFEYSILRALDPYTAGEMASLLDDITGGYEYRTADLAVITPPELQALRNAVQVKAYDMLGAPCTGYSQVNCRVLRVGLRQSTPHFHSIASMALFYPAKEELINAGGDNWWNSSLYQIGNGPFVLTTLEPFVRSYYTPNPQYWRGQPGYNIEFQYIDDSSLALQAYQAGQIDVMAVTADIAGAVGGDPVLLGQLKTYNGSCSYMVAYHNLKPPFNNQHVREAFSYAIDRDAWVEWVLSGNGLPTLTWIPQGFPGYDANETRWDYNPTAALQALAAGGYTVANGELIGPDAQPIPIIDTFNDTPRNRTRHQWLIDQWYEVLGIQVQFNPVDYATWNEMLNGDISVIPPIYINGWCADYPDPQNWLSVYWKGTSSFAQRLGYNNSTLNAMLTEADSTIDPVLRLQRYAAAQQTLIGDAPATFLWNSILTYLVKPRVVGEISTPMDYLWSGEIDPLAIQLGYPMYLPAIIKAPLPTNDITWKVVNSQTTTPINGLAMLNANDIWATGANPMSGEPKNSVVLRWNGASWQSAASPTTTDILSDIDFLTSSDGWLVGTCRLYHWNGSTWFGYPTPSCNYIKSVDMVAANDVWAASYGSILHWDGSSWSIAYSPASYPWVRDLDMVSATDGWFVTWGGSVYRWNGSTWNLFATFGNNLEAIDMLSATDGWIVGDSGTILHWNGTTWTPVSSPVSTSFTDVSMASGSRGWIVGGTNVLIWNGVSWTQQLQPSTSGLNTVQAVSENEAWAAGWDGVTIHYSNQP